MPIHKDDSSSCVGRTTSHPLKAGETWSSVLRSPNRALGLGQVTAHKIQDARVHPSEQSQPRVEKKKCKAAQAKTQATDCSAVLGRSRSVATFSGHY
jgi:hypothetical protein